MNGLGEVQYRRRLGCLWFEGCWLARGDKEGRECTHGSVFEDEGGDFPDALALEVDHFLR